MSLNIYDTHFMLAAVKELPAEHKFFKPRYFPTNEALDIFGTTRVLADYKEYGTKKAPFVLPRVGGIPVERDGFSTYDMEPANISVSLPLTIDELEKRGFGESLMSNLTPAQREQNLLIEDLATLSAMITRAEEALAVSVMIDNGCTMRHLTDKEGVYKDIKVKYYDGPSNPALFTPANAWSHSTYSNGTWTPGNWYDDICTMIGMLVKKGRPAKEILVATDVADFLMTDGWILAMLDNRRAEMGTLAPEALTEYVYELGTFNFKGRKLTIIACDGTYEEGGSDVPYIPDGTVIVTAPNCGKGLYGGVTQITPEGKTVTYAGTRVPQHIFTVRPPVKETMLTSRPLFAPQRANPWVTAKSVLGS